MRNNKLIIVTVVLVILFAASVVCVTGCSQQAKNYEIKARIKRIAEDAYNNGNVDALDEQLVQDYIRHIPPDPDVIGLNAFKEEIKNYRLTFPDCRLTIGEITIDGNFGSAQWTFQGTYSGQTPGTVSLAGKRLIITGCSMVRLESGKSVEEWVYSDYLGMEQQRRALGEGPALKSVHLLNLPPDVSDSQMVSAINEVNKVISDLGYPGAGYRLWKVRGDITTGYKYLWEGTWSSQAAYDVIHENENYQNSWSPNEAMIQKVMDAQIYQRYSEVAPVVTTR